MLTIGIGGYLTLRAAMVRKNTGVNKVHHTVWIEQKKYSWWRQQKSVTHWANWKILQKFSKHVLKNRNISGRKKGGDVTNKWSLDPHWVTKILNTWRKAVCGQALNISLTFLQLFSCGSGSGIDPDSMDAWISIRIRVRNPDPDSEGQKWPRKI